MTDIAFDLTTFRAMFPAFASVTAYPDAALTLYWNTACNYIEAEDLDLGFLDTSSRTLALNQMTAHLTQLGVNAGKGLAVGPVEQAKIDKVDVKLAQRPALNMWQWWLSGTPYGQMLLALLESVSVGGIYIGGAPELSAFRKVGGVW